MRLLSVGIPMIWLMIFSVAADVDFEKHFDYEAEFNRILDTRTEILNRAYFGNEDCECELREILAEPLLGEDIMNIRGTGDTELENVIGYEILDYELLSQDHGGAVIRAVIRWQEGDADEGGKQEPGYEYTVILQHTRDGGIKMSGFFLEAEVTASFFVKNFFVFLIKKRGN
ncbi:MAG: hypothetical protein Q4C14_00940 [Bacillota bacterium]|nr:hypothetical protein [Bacillota bacterium]